MAENGFENFKFYYYNPSIPGGIIFTVLFGLLFFLQFGSTLYSFITIFKKRPLGYGRKLEERSNSTNQIERQAKSKFKYGGTSIIYILLPFFIGLACEFVAHIARAASHNNIESRNLYIIQTLLMLIAPPLFSATLYMTFGRLVTYVLKNEKYLLLYPKYITKICVAGDVFSLLLQAGGGGMLATVETVPSNYQLGQNIILGGLGVQILFFGFFVVVEVTYFIRLSRNLQLTSYNSTVLNGNLKRFPNKLQTWRTILLSLFICSIFVLIRSVFRIVEFKEERGGYISSNEWCIYIFDSLMMLLNGILFVSQDISSYFLKAIPITWQDQDSLVTEDTSVKELDELNQ
ncbi:putative membrane protein [Wickerhamomyces ciferrii]|uniref:Membrane protein n=1 Tax=Wickerhamomyces ciferrii (strain ATCC 14091 / BCRC 22168 / CBS 111 / JCM 3599 / NBRC 0793 / NRRL Y-1031 F-60-10) TaxID=1206466 RepID=K0K8N6_WICCF|nr:uncharacterized protein BN7_737 [Wickerhamomyces ciferrii]CCH41200.1 putative membrane protein [Wickerhamomyces ciferrii]